MASRQRAIVVVFTVAIIITILYSFLLSFFFEFTADGRESYDDIAKNLIAGRGYIYNLDEPPPLWRPPLYPLLLAGIYFIFGTSNLPVIILQICLNGMTCVLIYLIATEIFNHRIGLISALGTACYPFFSYYVVRILSETIFTLILAGLLFSLIKAYRTLRARDFFLVGLLQGLGSLCRLSLQFFLLFMVVGLLFRTQNKKRIVVNTVVMVVAMVLPILPWSVYNYHITRNVVFLGTGGGYALWVTNHVPTDGLDDDQLSGEQLELFEQTRDRITGGQKPYISIENNKKFLRQAFREIVTSPLGFVIMLFKKLFRFWFSPFSPEYSWMLPILLVTQGILLILAMTGLFFSFKAGKDGWIPFLVIVYFTGLHTLVGSTFRYSLPIMPYVIILAVYGVQKLGFLPIQMDTTFDLTGKLGTFKERDSVP